MATYYVCTVAHTSSALTEPGVGANWMTVWEELVYQEGDVVSNGGTSYVAIVTHTAMTTNVPGVGVDWMDFWQQLVETQTFSGVSMIVSGGGFDLNDGLKPGYVSIPFDCEIIEASLLADAAGDVVVDLWVDTYGVYPPTNADSITGGNELTLVAANKTTDATLTGWSTGLSAGDVLAVNLDSVSSIRYLTVALRLQKT